MDEIENPLLTSDLIPGPDADWEEIFDFALTFDGYNHYGSFENLLKIVDKQRYDTLVELRACFFLNSEFGMSRMRSLKESTSSNLNFLFRQFVIK